jgi:threonine synthase
LYKEVGYVLDPHTAVGVEAARRSARRSATAAAAGDAEDKGESSDGEVEAQVLEGDKVHIISRSTAHPAKFGGAVNLALKEEEGFAFEEKVLPVEFVGLEKREKRVRDVENDWKAVRELVKAEVEDELKGAR